MTTALIIASALAYTATVLWAARRLYGRWRANSIDKQMREHSHIYDEEQRLAEALGWFAVDRPFLMMGALLAATAWPAAVPVWALCAGVVRWLDSTPARSRAELATERNAMVRRIEQLEAELGIPCDGCGCTATTASPCSMPMPQRRTST